MSAIGILPMMQLEKGGESPTKTGLLGSGVRYFQQNNSEVVIKTCSICVQNFKSIDIHNFLTNVVLFRCTEMENGHIL